MAPPPKHWAHVALPAKWLGPAGLLGARADAEPLFAAGPPPALGTGLAGRRPLCLGRGDGVALAGGTELAT